MSTASLKVAMANGATGGRWEATADSPYAVGGAQIVSTSSGTVDSTGTLRSPAGTGVASIPLPAFPTTSGVWGTIQITFTNPAGMTMQGRPIRIEFKETAPGVMDVATLINAARPIVTTPTLPPFVPTPAAPIVIPPLPIVTAAINQLANGLQLVWPSSVALVMYIVMVQRAGRLFYPVAVGTGTTWTDPEVSDGETVRYQVLGVDASGAASVVLDLSKSQQPRAYTDPITITAPGTYQNLNINNEDPNGQAVRVKAGVQGVTLNNLRLRTRNDAIYLETGSATNIQNVVGWARHPLVSGRVKGKFIAGLIPASVVAQHVAFEGFSFGVYVDGQSTTNVQKILLQYWRSRNNDGRQTNANGYDLVRGVAGHAFQANSVFQCPSFDVLDGEAIQEAGAGLVEDVLSVFVSAGTTNRRALVSRNAIYGLWPLDPTAQPNTPQGGQAGCGIISDGQSDGTPGQLGNLEISYNLVVATANVGIGISNGNGLEVHHNQILISGYQPDGRTVSKPTNVGMYVSAAYAGTNGTLSNASIHDNTSMCWNLLGSQNKNPGNGYIYNNGYDFGQVGQNGNTQSNNSYDGRTADVALESAAYLAFVKSQVNAGRSAGSTAF